MRMYIIDRMKLPFRMFGGGGGELLSAVLCTFCVSITHEDPSLSFLLAIKNETIWNTRDFFFFYVILLFEDENEGKEEAISLHITFQKKSRRKLELNFYISFS